MRRYSITVALGLILAVIISGLFTAWLSINPTNAANITTAKYLSILRISNNGSAQTNTFVPFSNNSSRLVTSNYLNSDLSNCAIVSNTGEYVPFMPAPGGTHWWSVFVISLPVSGEFEEINTDYLLYLGGSANMGAPIYYFPGDAGMSWADSPTCELGDNFDVTFRGWFDTSDGAEKSFLHKASAISVYVSGDDEITAETRGGIGTNSTILRPSGAGAFTQIDNVSGNATHWEAVADIVADDDTSYVTDTAVDGATPYDTYALPDPSLSANCTDIDVTIYIRAKQTASDLQLYAWPAIYTNSTYKVGGQKTLTTSYQDFTWYLAANPVTGNDWTSAEIDALQAGVQIIGSPGPGWSARVRCTQVYAFVEYVEESTIDTVTATGIPTGYNTVSVSANTSHFMISVNGTVRDSTTLTIPITNNDNTWYAFQNGSMPYADYLSISINGTPRQFISWQNSETFTDQTGNGHTVTPTFRNTPSDNAVSAALISLAPIQESQATDWTLGASSNLTCIPSEPSLMYSEGTVNFPGAAMFNHALDAAGIDHPIFWFPLTALVIIGVGFFTYRLTPSLFLKSTIQFTFLVFATLVNVWGGWAALYYALWAISLLVISKHYSF